MPAPVKDAIVRAFERNDRDIRCRQAIETAWDQVKRTYPIASFRRRSTIHGLMWEHSVQQVGQAFADDPGMRAIPHFDTMSFTVDDFILMRLKKADDQLLTSNYQTRLASDFDNHDRDLYGHRGFQRVEIVHTFNRFLTELRFIGIVAREDGEVLWQHELRSGGAVVVPLPLSPKLAPAADTVLKPVQPSADKSDKEEK